MRELNLLSSYLVSYYTEVLKMALEIEDDEERREEYLVLCGGLEATHNFIKAFELIVESTKDAETTEE